MGLCKLLKFNLCLFFFCVIFSAFAFADETYTVSKGDTLYSISRKYEITVAELRAANNLSEKDVLKVGAKLVIPSADISNAAALTSINTKAPVSKTNDSSKNSIVTYEVQKGDTLYGIARKSGIKLPELLAMNSLDNNATLKVGQKLKVPGVSGKTSVVASNSNNSKTLQTQVKTQNIEKNTSKKSEVIISNGVIWPLSNPVVKNINGKVSGVQLTGKENEAVKCVREGTVMYTGVYRGFGEVVFVQSKTGLIYSYTGLSSVSSKKGDYVLAGTEIGFTGKGNEATIKFMVFQNGTPVDPSKAPRG